MKDSRSFSALAYLSFFGLAITVPLLVLLGALLLQSASEQRGQLQRRVSQVLDAVVSDIDRDLDRDITILHTLGTSQALVTADWPTFYDQAKAGLQGRAYLVLVDSTGRQLVNTFVPYGQQPAMTGDPETVRRIVQTKEPVVSNLFVSLVVNKPVFNVSIPVLQNGQVRYVMSLGLLPDDLVTLLTSQRLESQWVTLIWDAKGMILARSRDNARYVGSQLPANMREHNQPGVARTVNLDGIDVLHATARSRVSGWGVGVNVPYSVIANQLRNSLLVWSTATVLAITIALALGLFFARRMTTSLSVAAQAATAFGRGEPFAIAGSGINEVDTFLTTLEDAQRVRRRTEQERTTLIADLETAVRARDDFLSIASHELRNPVNAVHLQLVGVLRALQREGEGVPLEDVQDRVTRANAQVGRLTRLMENLLDVSRIAGGSIPLDCQDVNLVGVVNTVVQQFRDEAKPGQITFTADRPVEGRWDRLRLEQIVSNLLSNAIKYGNGEPIAVTLDADDNAARLTVQDNGIGIAPEQHERLFTRFGRAVSGRQYGGFGLGLWITKQLLDAMGGSISVAGRPGHGATFAIVLPLGSDKVEGADSGGG